MENLFEEIRKLEKEKDFSHYKISAGTIKTIEGKLELTLPFEYVLFLKAFGDGGLIGFEIWGVDNGGVLNVVNETIKYRTLGLEKHYISIESCDEWIVCIDSLTHKVVYWYPSENDYCLRYNCFIDYLRDRVIDYKDNFC